MPKLPEKIYLNDTGIEFRVQLVDQDNNTINIANAITLSIHAKRPDGTVVTWVAEKGANSGVLPSELGWMSYVSEEGDLNMVGRWTLQVHVVTADGRRHTDTDDILVHQPLAS